MELAELQAQMEQAVLQELQGKVLHGKVISSTVNFTQEIV